MSSKLYATGLWWYGAGSKPWGIAKLHGRERRLESAPQLLGMSLTLIEYVPLTDLRHIKEVEGDPRDMNRDEVRAADAYLRLMLPDGET